MRILDKFISVIFSLVMLVVGITVLLAAGGFAEKNLIIDFITTYIFAEKYEDVALITSLVVIIAALKTTVFLSDFSKSKEQPILVSTEHGKIEVAQETINNTVKSIANSFPEIREIHSKMLNKKEGIRVFASILVASQTNIKELTKNFQDRVIEVIEETTGVRVLDTNIKVKNLSEKAKKEEVKTEMKIEPKPNKTIDNTNPVAQETVQIPGNEEVQEAQEEVKEEIIEEIAEEKVTKQEEQ